MAIRLIALTALLALAVTMAVFTLADFRQDASAEERLVLADYEGSVAVFRGKDREMPLQVTDISLKSLRESDRKMVEVGMVVSSREELAALLEDLGS